MAPKAPSYRLHKPSGKAVVTVNGKDYLDTGCQLCNALDRLESSIEAPFRTTLVSIHHECELNQGASGFEHLNPLREDCPLVRYFEHRGGDWGILPNHSDSAACNHLVEYWGRWTSVNGRVPVMTME